MQYLEYQKAIVLPRSYFWKLLDQPWKARRGSALSRNKQNILEFYRIVVIFLFGLSPLYFLTRYISGSVRFPYANSYGFNWVIIHFFGAKVLLDESFIIYSLFLYHKMLRGNKQCYRSLIIVSWFFTSIFLIKDNLLQMESSQYCLISAKKGIAI